MEFSVTSSPHLRPAISVSQVMLKLLLALLPAVLIYCLLYGWSIVINLAVGCGMALALEALFLRWRHRPVKKHLSDYTAIVTAVLLVLAMPPLASWWLIALGMLFAIGLGKQVYGGLGYNPFNPAMIGYVMLLISFPTEMSYWPETMGLLGSSEQSWSIANAFHFLISGVVPAGQTLDGITSATLLAEMDNAFSRGETLQELRAASPVFGVLGSAGWEWISLAYLAGGLWLLQQKVIRWQIPVTILASLAAISCIFWLVDSDQYLSPLTHIFSGSALLGAFFIATDPVSASTTRRGRIWYGIGIGLLIFVIRTWGAYPDGVAFAVLLMNLCVPMIDYYTQPRVYGHGNKEQGRS